MCGKLQFRTANLHVRIDNKARSLRQASRVMNQ